jgi:hypothetical protein
MVFTGGSLFVFLALLWMYFDPLGSEPTNGTEHALGGAFKNFLVVPLFVMGAVSAFSGWVLYEQRPREPHGKE